VINASDLDGEFDAVQAAFNGSTGHSHDGTTGEGPQIATTGLADGAVTSAKLDTNIAIAGTLGVTGVSSFANGSNSAPSLTFTSDTNTGIYRGGTDILKFVTAGTDAITIDSDQDVILGNKLLLKASLSNPIIFENQHSVTTDASISTYDDVNGTLISLGSNFYLNNGSEQRFNTGEESSAVVLNRTGTVQLKTGSTGAIAVDRFKVDSAGDISFYEDTGSTPKLFWDASEERLGIGNASPSSPLHISLPSSGTDVEGWRVSSGGGGILYVRVDNAASANPTWEMNVAASEQLAFGIGASEAMRIDSNGNVGIGGTPSNRLDIFGDTAGINIRDTSAYSAGTGPSINFIGLDNNEATKAFGIISGLSVSTDNGLLTFTTRNSGTLTERMRIDNSGNLLVGTTSTIPYTFSSGTGAGITSSGTFMAGATAESGLFNRVGSDGNIINFYRSGGIVGHIGSGNGVVTYYIIDPRGSGVGITATTTAIYPCSALGVAADNVYDWGFSSVRWDDIYATNGTIQTSDRNEKQDIEELSDAEQRVAVVAKGLMRKFRWKDKVAEKGDNARTHFGIIAQDLQDAFTAEGLDAGDYAMFTSNTWWEKEISVDAVEADEANGIEAKDAYTYMDTKEEATEGYTERTRLGVRYNQLLAFIISAI
jgi:hypothetical protein